MNSSPTSVREHRDSLVASMVAARSERDWCLFLDRDGVINRQVRGDYVRNWGDFAWLPRAREALSLLRRWAPTIVVVTNQQGVGKGLMTLDDVTEIHRRLQDGLAEVGGAVDAFRVCPHLESDACACRKPATGLVLDFLNLRPASEPSLSIMVGDSPSDVELARNVATEVGGCGSIQIGRSGPLANADVSFGSLWSFARAVANAREGKGE